jgi:hypothetical protein
MKKSFARSDLDGGMRIVDKKITGQDLAVLAERYFDRLNPKTKKGSYWVDCPAGKLISLSKRQHGKRYGKVINHLAANVKRVFTAPPEDLMKLHDELVALNGRKDELQGKQFKKAVQPVFGYYTQFRKSSTRGLVHDWFVGLNLRTCPYCNRDWLSHFGTKGRTDGLFLFDIDHFFPQAKYPYLALSFYNLIPSCATCNQRLKRDREMSLATHVHPYAEDLDRMIRFDVPIKKVAQFYKKDVAIDLSLVQPRGVADADFKRAEETCKFFKLHELYETHKDYARELMQKGLVYSESQVQELWDTYRDDVFQSKAEVVQMIMGNYVQSTDIHKRPLAKLTKDLAEQFDLYKILLKP